MSLVKPAELRLLGGLAGAAVVSILLFGYGCLMNHSLTYWFLLWNLFLAWLPIVFALALRYWTQAHLWSSWVGIALSALWLSFLPNSFYMISDYIHLQETGRADVLFDVITFTSFIVNGLAVGFMSLYLVHRMLLKRLPAINAARTVGVVLLLCSFAIYLGRDLRWNTWDLITNPAGVLFDVSDRLFTPWQHTQMFTTTLSFFVLLGSFYSLLWLTMGVSRPGSD